MNTGGLLGNIIEKHCGGRHAHLYVGHMVGRYLMPKVEKRKKQGRPAGARKTSMNPAAESTIQASRKRGRPRAALCPQCHDRIHPMKGCFCH
jgi:hypothetical protein